MVPSLLGARLYEYLRFCWPTLPHGVFWAQFWELSAGMGWYGSNMDQSSRLQPIFRIDPLLFYHLFQNRYSCFKLALSDPSLTKSSFGNRRISRSATLPRRTLRGFSHRPGSVTWSHLASGPVAEWSRRAPIRKGDKNSDGMDWGDWNKQQRWDFTNRDWVATRIFKVFFGSRNGDLMKRKWGCKP